MKRKQLEEIKLKTIKELKIQLSDLKKEVADLTIEMATGKNKNVALIGEKKKEIAVILTIIRQKELNQV